MSWLLRNNWPWPLLAFLLGAVITWILLDRRTKPPTEQPAEAEAEAKEEALVGAATATARQAQPAARAKPTKPKPEPAVPAEAAQPAPEPTAPAEPAAREAAVPDEAAVPSEPAAPAELVARETPLPAEPTAPAADEAVVPASGEAKLAAAPEFSRLMDVGASAEPTLFDEVAAGDDEPAAGRFGPGSADAVPHQGPPDGFTIKGNAQSMLFHTPDSPYYGRTKAEVWFRTEADAERAGFTKYLRKPRKSAAPNATDQ
ncbi:hypothetical protein OG474_03285 [Kribbella sp. NBC_01505]|uniref:sunset domain-containing protein n=1 Tax=Kribbella sp. NBC_01505 TaxID=2903580 RepID=UPI003867197D